MIDIDIDKEFQKKIEEVIERNKSTIKRYIPRQTVSKILAQNNKSFSKISSDTKDKSENLDESDIKSLLKTLMPTHNEEYQSFDSDSIKGNKNTHEILKTTYETNPNFLNNLKVYSNLNNSNAEHTIKNTHEINMQNAIIDDQNTHSKFCGLPQKCEIF